MDKKLRRQRAVSALESMVATEQHQMRNARKVCFVLDSPRLPYGRRAKSSFEESGQSIRMKRRMPSAIERERTRLLMGTEIGMLGCYGFQGQVTAGDDSDERDNMGAGYNDLRIKKEKQQCKEEEGSSSTRRELTAFFLALRDTLIEEQLLYLYDNQSLLKAVKRWIGEGGKATLVGAPDADILAAAIEILRKRNAAGTATFLVKVKAHRGDLANQVADILADKAMSDPKVGKEWCQRTNRSVFTWKKPCYEAEKVTHQDRHSTFDNSMRNAMRRGAAENKVQKNMKRSLQVLEDR